MSFQPYLNRPKINPVPKGTTRPLWSVMIPTYNCAGYLKTALSSVLAQAPGPEVMQIEVIDDCSDKDDPRQVVEEIGKGRVQFFRQARNQGYIKNFETYLQRSRGHLVHLLHGDDFVQEGFYQKIQAAFATHPEIGAAFCFHTYVDENGGFLGDAPRESAESGILENWLERIAVEQRIQTPAIVVRRRVYEELGGFDRRFSCSGEDWEMWVRIAVQYPVWYETEQLASYRMHVQSLSGSSVRTGADIQDLRMGIGIMSTYLPPALARRTTPKALENVALYAIRYQMARMLALGDYKGAMLQLREALRCQASPRVLLALFNLAGLRRNLYHERSRLRRALKASV